MNKLNEDKVEIIIPILISILLIIYLIHVYYPYHYTILTPITIVAISAIFFVIGFYSFVIKKTVIFTDIKYLYLVFLLFSFVSLSLILFAMIKHGLQEEIDIMLVWGFNLIGIPYLVINTMLSFIAYFFILAGTRKIFGKNHFFIWIIIFIAWAFSGIRLILNYILR